MNDYDILRFLAVSLAVGLIVGFERGWHERVVEEGQRVAGIRTFALMGLSGGLVSIIATSLSEALAAAIALGFAGLLVAIRVGARSGGDVGATTEVASIVTFCLGILAGTGYLVPAIAGAVVSALLLGAKPVLHRWLNAIEEKELFAALQLLLISAVVLPLLPNQGYGPYAALNPYRVWLMVVLVAGLSFAGYVVAKLKGTGHGVILTGVVGGLVTSTATSLALLRAGRSDPSLQRSVPAAVVGSNTVMMARMSLLAIMIHPPIWLDVVGPFAVMILAGTGIAAVLWPTENEPSQASVVHENPLALRTALTFALILAIITFLVEVIRNHVGVTGIYGLAALSGLVDVDAITVSLADQASRGLTAEVVVMGLVIAAIANTLIKVGMALVLAQAPVTWRIVWGLAGVSVAGSLAAAVQLYLKSF